MNAYSNDLPVRDALLDSLVLIENYFMQESSKYLIITIIVVVVVIVFLVSVVR